jgi:hypothetical protein
MFGVAAPRKVDFDAQAAKQDLSVYPGTS